MQTNHESYSARGVEFTLLTAAAMLVIAGAWWLLDGRPVIGGASVEPLRALVSIPSPAEGARDAIAESAELVTAFVAPEPVESLDVALPEISSSQADEIETIDHGFVPTFDGRRIRSVRTVRMLVTAYSPDERSCGIFADNITASGYSVWTNAMKLVAADTSSLPFGTVLTIPGYNNGWPVPVLDRGGAIKGQRLDVLYPTHEEALEWGAQWLDVTVWSYAD